MESSNLFLLYISLIRLSVTVYRMLNVAGLFWCCIFFSCSRKHILIVASMHIPACELESSVHSD